MAQTFGINAARIGVQDIQDATQGNAVEYDHKGEHFKAKRLYEFHTGGDAVFGIAKKLLGGKGHPDQRCKIIINKDGIEVDHKGEKNEPSERVQQKAADKWLAEKQKQQKQGAANV